ncbi:Ig-like domain-containing protein [Brevibacillus brevis]|uniref:Ig-like domain-containing protein n=1 Tax=Brevibacillus brevis TaxID=1393 RepID=A0ABY9T3Y1_BREBE|nr:Ig-like domain-containing protein [Brevibacillus brevis]WNC14800.1 Ig-like domain-containing protein [Brevibacillus brevis]
MLNDINWRKIGMMFLILSIVFTGVSFGTPVSYAASSEVYVASNGSDTSGDGTKENPYATLYTAYQNDNSGGTIYVLDNIKTLSDTNKKYNLNKIFTITTAPGVTETAVIERNQAGNGTLFDLNTGQLTLKNIIIDGTYQGGALAQGRIINVYDAQLNIEEGTVLRNSYSPFVGSAIYLGQGSAVLKMTGGEITGNKGEKNQSNAMGAVYIGSGSKFLLTGGRITNNIGGGVDLVSGTFDLSGNATVMGNTDWGQQKALNVFLQGKTNLTLSGEFSGKAGITAQSRMAAGGIFGQAATGDLASLENLIADDSSLYAIYGASNELLWKAPPTVMIEQPAGDKVFNSKPMFEGTSTAGSTITVEIKDKAGNVVDTPTVTVDADGKWTFTPTNDLTDGEYTVAVTATIDGKSTKAEKVITIVDE